MKSEWKVMCNPMMGDTPFTVYRVIDTSKPVHSGNIEYYESGQWFFGRGDAQFIADSLNEEGET